MIKGLQGISGVLVTGGNTALPYIGPNPNNPITGMMRVNGTEIEVFNGSSWQQLSTSYATVGLDQDVLDVVQWARKKRDEERDLVQRMEQHPGLRQAYEQFKIMDILTLEEKKNEQPA